MILSRVQAIAEVVKLVDTQVSGTCGGNPVEVRVLSSALTGFLMYRQTDVEEQLFHFDRGPLK